MIPATAYSQVAELSNVSTPTQTQTQTPVSTQCLDFNQDRICESIVLVNGTIIKNPDLPRHSVSMNGSSSNLTTNATTQNATSRIKDQHIPEVITYYVGQEKRQFDKNDPSIVVCNPNYQTCNFPPEIRT